MPTGYTYKIEDGVTFPEYAMHCARAFGALITLHDYPDTAIPEEFTADTKYDDERIVQAQSEINELTAMSDEEMGTRASADYERQMARWNESVLEKKELERKYADMRAKRLSHGSHHRPIMRI